MNRISNRILALLALLSLSTILSAQEKGYFSESIVLFGDRTAPPALIDSERGWIPVAAIDWDNRDIAVPGVDEGRRWRLKTSYEHEGSGGPATIQVRLRGPATGPTFTHPWSEGADLKAEAYSNWFEDTESIVISRSGRGYVEVRLIAPPRTPISGRLHSITLEAWDYSQNPERAFETAAGPSVNLAYAQPLPMMRVKNSPAAASDFDAENPDIGPKSALTFSLSFVEACLTGDLPAYYRTQSDPVRSLDDGKAVAKYRLNPPTGIPGISDLDDYKRRYDYKIYDSSVYGELFPEWFDTSRPWIPDVESFLFMGHHDRFSGAFPDDVDYLVFLVEADEEGTWKVVARPGN